MSRSALQLSSLLLILATCTQCAPTPAHPATTAVRYRRHEFWFGPTYDREVSVDARGLLVCTDTFTKPGSPPITDTASRQLTAAERAELVKALSALPNSDLTIPMVPDGPSIQMDYDGHHFFCGSSPNHRALNEVSNLIEKLAEGMTSGKATPSGVR